MESSNNNTSMKRSRELPAVSPYDERMMTMNNNNCGSSSDRVSQEHENLVPQLFSPIPYKSNINNNNMGMDSDNANLIKRFRHNYDNDNNNNNDVSVNNDNMSMNRNTSDNVLSFFGLQERAKKRKNNSECQSSSSSSSSNENVGFLTAINNELQVQLSKKTDEVNSNKQLIQQLGMVVFNNQEKCKQMEEENKLLKRAVAIQDSRNKELSEVNHQYQAMLQQASIYVQTLERQNNQLRSVLNISSDGGGGAYNDFHPQPPPDGY